MKDRSIEQSWSKIYQRSLDCVHCGLCLPVCPTYRETGRESSSPRGRIYLFRAVAEGRIEPTDAVEQEAYLCLGCRACETACPSGVRYGNMLELVREQIRAEGIGDGWPRRIERWALRGLIPHRRRLAWAMALLHIAQKLRLDRALLPLLPGALRELHGALPVIPPANARRRLPRLTPAVGEKRGRVGFLVGCVMPELFGSINAATVRVLARNGFDVVVPDAQSCCGALHAHAGDMQYARRLAERNTQAFGDAAVDVVVTNSAGCGAALREAGEWLPGRGEALAASACDVCEFLDAVGLRPPTGRVDARVCYDDPCHLVHGQRVEAAPRRLLAALPGLELVAHADPASCCGAAGTYNLTHREMSLAVLERKLETLAAVAPDFVATGNPGCLMQLRSGAERAGFATEVVHPVELLDRAYTNG